MTPERLAEIEARANRALPGPWTARRDYVDDLHFGSVKCTILDAPARNLFAVAGMAMADAEFIAHARTDVEDLLAELNVARTALDQIRAEAEQARSDAMPINPGVLLRILDEEGPEQ
jgi:hypothetical protein